MSNVYTIYKIINMINNKIYIGFTSGSIENRFNGHISKSLNHDSKYLLHNAIRKYTPNNFIIESICCSRDKDYTLNFLESYFIKEYKSNNKKYGYNMTKGGEGTIGYKHKDESKEKMSLFHTGKQLSDYHKQQIKIGKKKSKYIIADEIKEKIRNTMIGQKYSDERKEKISLSLKGKTPWNKGLTKETNKSLQVISEKMKGDNNPSKKFGGPMNGKNHSNKTKQKISETYKRKVHS